MIKREVFWKFVELGLMGAHSLTTSQIIRAYRRVWRNEIDLFIGGYDQTLDESEDKAALALKAADYVDWVLKSCPKDKVPDWFKAFLVNYPD